MRKWPDIDLFKFAVEMYPDRFKKYLLKCEEDQNITSLVSTYYGLQKGMQKCVRDKINTPMIVKIFINSQRGCERVLRRIYMNKYREYYKDPLIAEGVREAVLKKRKKDGEFEKWLRKQRY